MIDGYSTGGTPGNGLGAVQRLATEFEVYSIQPSGTAIVALVGDRRTPESGFVRWSCLSLPARGETVCGDAWRFSQQAGIAAFMIADGLGHGPDAAAASELAGTVFEGAPFGEVGEFIEQTHRSMVGTRGAAVAIARLDGRNGTLHYAGIGNISGTLISSSSRQGLSSQNGIVGARLPRTRSLEYAAPDSGVLIMHSDGLQTRWTLESYPGLARAHPALIAAVLFRDFFRGRDDVTVLVGTWQGGSLP
jgi:hypothetical protein